jgi:glycerate kinase
VIPRTVLIAVEPFGDGLDARRAALAIARGLQAGDPSLGVDPCPIETATRGDGLAATRKPDSTPGGRQATRSNVPTAPEDLRELLEALNFDTRMRAARAVVVGGARLDERTLLGSPTFEIATRARQAGVPAYAVAKENKLSLFDARILDLQVILQARDPRGLRRAGEELAAVV